MTQIAVGKSRPLSVQPRLKVEKGLLWNLVLAESRFIEKDESTEWLAGSEDRVERPARSENRSYAATLVMIIVSGLPGAARRRNSSGKELDNRSGGHI